MPYKNIVYAKLEKRLLEDPRWYMMSEISQLHYIKLILIAQQTYNRIPAECKAIQRAFKTDLKLKTIENSLNEIQKNFPKFKKDANFYYFEDFEEKTNYIRAIPSNAEGLPKDGIDKEKEKKRERKDKEEESIRTLWISTFGRNPKIPEEEETETLIKKFGYERVKLIYKSASLRGFKNLNTLLEALDENGNIKPRENNGNGNNRKDNGASPDFLRELVTKRAEAERS